ILGWDLVTIAGADRGEVCIRHPCIALHSRSIQSSLSPSKSHPAHYVKYMQHTVNPLISPDINPFLPSVISTVSVLFY
ncbi:unnamed protein product, partial [Staurois parvus]